MSTETEVLYTHVKGYFNPNSYKVNVSISERGGMSWQLNPMEFIQERGSGRKFNDPILDKYVGCKMLSPELSHAPVPVLLIPRMAAPVQSLHVVNQGARGLDGKWGLPAPGSQPEQTIVKVPPSVTKPSVTAMSMENARKLGFVGKAKLVDDNYGAAETGGAPTRGDAIPRIKYAMESQAPRARSGQLPKELVEQVDPRAASLIAGLEKAAQADPETPNLGRKAAERAVEAEQGVAGVKNFRVEKKQVSAKAKMPSAVIPPPSRSVLEAPKPSVQVVSVPRRRVGQVVASVPQPSATEAPFTAGKADLPPPVLESSPAPQPPATEAPLMGGKVGLPPPTLEDSQVPEPELSPTAKDRANNKAPIRCGACSEEFKYPSQYERHVLRKHRDRLQELLLSK